MALSTRRRSTARCWSWSWRAGRSWPRRFASSIPSGRTPCRRLSPGARCPRRSSSKYPTHYYRCTKIPQVRRSSQPEWRRGSRRSTMPITTIFAAKPSWRSAYCSISSLWDRHMTMPSFIANPVRLGPLDAVADRPFTAPEHSHSDLAILERMRARLRDTLAPSGVNVDRSAQSEVHVQYVHEEHERMHRMVICDRAALATAPALAVVGFFGEQRGKANPALLQDIDTELIQEFLQHRDVLSYSSLEL